MPRYEKDVGTTDEGDSIIRVYEWVDIDAFFNDLEDVLNKHLDNDWEWSYESEKPLLITSEMLDKAWDKSEEKHELISKAETNIGENNNA